MMDSLVSIVVPVYKVEEYLEKCINALKSQTYSNIEVILVDDGSPDRCGAICEEASSSDHRFKAFHKENGGLADARNYGLDRISGEYVTFVDSDDYVADDYVKRLLDMLFEDGSDISVCGVAGFSLDENGRGIFPEVRISGEHVSCSADDALAKMLRQDGFDTEAWAKMYRSSVFEDIRYPVGVFNEDLPTTYRCFLKADKVSFSEDKLYYYLQRAGSIMGNRSNVKRYSDSVNNVETMLEDVSEKRPVLAKAARSRALSVYFQSFAGADLCGDTELKKYCWGKIRALRTGVLADPDARPKARAAALISYLGQNAFMRAYDRFVRQ